MTDEYAELLEEARIALNNLLMGSEPGTGLELHRAYNAIKRSQERAAGAHPPLSLDAKRSDKQKAAYDQRARERLEQKIAWKNLSKAERERTMLHVIGEGRLTLGESTNGFQAELGDGYDIYQGHARTVLLNLLRAGEVDREAEQWRGKKRWRYFRTPLAGPIVELEQAFHGAEELDEPDEPTESGVG